MRRPDAPAASPREPIVIEKVDRFPSHSSNELPTYIEINRLRFAVHAWTLTGAELRQLPFPAIGDDYDLWKVAWGGPDGLVADDDVVELRGGRFFSAPKIINAGATREGVAACGDGTTPPAVPGERA